MQNCKRGILIKLYKSHEPAHAPHWTLISCTRVDRIVIHFPDSYTTSREPSLPYLVFDGPAPLPMNKEVFKGGLIVSPQWPRIVPRIRSHINRLTIEIEIALIPEENIFHFMISGSSGSIVWPRNLVRLLCRGHSIY